MDKIEVDFIINNEIAIEVKSSKKIKGEHFKGLKHITNEGLIKNRYLVTNDPLQKTIDGINCLNWEVFLEKMWSDKLF